MCLPKARRSSEPRDAAAETLGAGSLLSGGGHSLECEVRVPQPPQARYSGHSHDLASHTAQCHRGGSSPQLLLPTVASPPLCVRLVARPLKGRPGGLPYPCSASCRYIQMLKDHRPRMEWDSEAKEHFFEYKK